MNVYPVATGGYVVYLSADAVGNAGVFLAVTAGLMWVIWRDFWRRRGGK